MHTDARGVEPQDLDLDLEPAGSTGAPVSAVNGNRRPMKAPRSPFLDYLLHFFTFGLYSLFWMVARIRELRQLSGHPFTPWLWFFTPIVVIAQPIAYPIMIRHLRDVERARGLTPWGSVAWVWLGLVIVLSVVSTLFNWVAAPAWVITVTLLVWPVVCLWLESRFNRIKRTLSDSEVVLKKPRAIYSMVEWLLLLVLVPLVGWTLYLTDVEPLMVDRIATLESGTTFTGDQGEIRFPVAAGGWERVEPGLFGDEGTLYEFRGPHDFVHMAINHFPDSTLDEVVAWRKTAAHDDMVQSACEEQRTLSGRRLSVTAHFTCWGHSVGEPAVWTGTVVETEQGVYEMLGYMNIPRLSFEQVQPEMREMVGGFEVP